MKTINLIPDTSYFTVFREAEKSITNLLIYKFLDTQGFPMFRKMQVLKILADWGTKPFYANDLFVNDKSVGGWMNSLDLNRLIEATGNRKEIYTESGEQLYVKEWKLRVSPDEITKALNVVRNFIIQNI